MNKKTIFILIAVIILIITVVTIFIVRGTIYTDNVGSENSEVEEKFEVKYKGVNITPGTEFNPESISEEANLTEIASCAFDGTDKVYTYEDIEITVANINGKDTVYSVYFITDIPETAEGVKTFDSKDVMIEKYGENYETGTGSQCIYTKGNTELAFGIENDIITGITYTLLTSK